MLWPYIDKYIPYKAISLKENNSHKIHKDFSISKSFKKRGFSVLLATAYERKERIVLGKFEGEKQMLGESYE